MPTARLDPATIEETIRHALTQPTAGDDQFKVNDLSVSRPGGATTRVINQDSIDDLSDRSVEDDWPIEIPTYDEIEDQLRAHVGGVLVVFEHGVDHQAVLLAALEHVGESRAAELGIEARRDLRQRPGRPDRQVGDGGGDPPVTAGDGQSWADDAHRWCENPLYIKALSFVAGNGSGLTDPAYDYTTFPEIARCAADAYAQAGITNPRAELAMLSGHGGADPLNALRAFEAAARHLSVKKAAIELNVTPAAVSDLIAAHAGGS